MEPHDDESTLTGDAAGVPSAPLTPRAQEQLLIDLLPQLESGRVPPNRILCTSQGLAQFAVEAARRFPQSKVVCHFLDLYHAEQAQRAIGEKLANLTIFCGADFPADQFDCVVLPLSAAGETELVRDLLQAGHQALVEWGQMLVSTDNRRDRWLHEQLFELFGSVRPHSNELGAAYFATKERPLKKVKDFGCEFAFRDRDRLIRVYSRPGVFSHRHIDPGARQLINAMEIAAGDRVLDIGCGAGVVSLAAAFRAEGIAVHAVDSHARAVDCATRGTELNELTNITTELCASGAISQRGPFQVALANPPYYAQFRIAELFLTAAQAALEPGGRVLLVTKRPDWYGEHMCEWFEDPEIVVSKQYFLVSGRRPDWGDGT